jgi:hypothetical protein
MNDIADLASKPETPAPSSAAAPPGPAPSVVMVVRQIFVTHVELRTPTGESYFEGGARRLVKAENEPLGQFLADAHFSRGEGGQKKEVKVAYYFGEMPATLWRPMQFITPGILDAFEKAAREFYQKAHADQKAAEFQRTARLNFRLPDPDAEPDCYWLVGDRFSPRLVILWGCEKLGANNKPVPSLPLIKDSELFPRDVITVADKLRARLMNWEAIFKENLALISEKKEPIGRFLAKRVYDAQHEEVVGLQPALAPDSAFPITKFRPLKRLFAREVLAFEKAAQDYYAKAHEDEDSRTEYPQVTAYERELRRNFRLPDIDAPGAHLKAGPLGMEDMTDLMSLTRAKPQRKLDTKKRKKSSGPRYAYWVYGKQMSRRLMIAVDGNEPLEKCLFACPDEDLDIPPGAKGGGGVDGLRMAEQALGMGRKPSTVAEKLWLCVPNLAVPVAMAATILLLAAATWFVFGGHPKHMVVLTATISNDPELDPDNSRNVIEVSFNNPLALNAPPVSGKAPPQPGAPLGLYSLRLASKTGALPLQPPQRRRTDGKSVFLVVPGVEFEDTATSTYVLKLENVVDTWGNRLASTNLPVTFMDKRPPGLAGTFEPGADESTDLLRISFDEPLEKGFAETKENFSLSNTNDGLIDVDKAELQKDRKTVVLKASKPFRSKAIYTMTLRNIADASRARNVMPETVTNFVYVPVPLRLQTITANESQTRIKVEFNKLYDLASARNAIKLDAPLQIGAMVKLDDRALELQLTNSWLSPTSQYTLKIERLKEGGTTASTELTTNMPFAFMGASDTTPPVMTDLSYDLGRKFIQLTFSKPLMSDSATKEANYSIWAKPHDDWVQQTMRFNPTLIDAQTVRLGFAGDLPNATFQLKSDGVEDLTGNATNDSRQFSTGIGYCIEGAKGAVLNNGNAGIYFVLTGSIDPSCEKWENFSVTDPQGEPLPGVSVTGVRLIPGDNTTSVQLNLSRRLESESFKVLFSGLRLQGEARMQQGESGPSR